MATSSTLSRSFPTLKYAAAPFRWVARTRRRRWTTTLVLLTILAAPVVWWATQLLGLPDIGEPFDTKATRSSKVPDERNAYVLYGRAAALLTPASESTRLPADETVALLPWGKIPPRWPNASPRLRHAVEDNRAALAGYRGAAGRPDQAPVPPAD